MIIGLVLFGFAGLVFLALIAPDVRAFCSYLIGCTRRWFETP